LENLIMQVRRHVAALTLAALLALPSFARAATKTYQVTGPVLEVNDKMIVVQKDKERWEIERTADTKIDGDLKVGSKVTVYYHMVADKAEAKGTK